MDVRDETTWVAIELSRLGEQKVEEGELVPLLRSDLGVGEDFPVFVPTATYRKQHKVITIHLVEGYVFVAAGLPEKSYFDLERQPYVSSVMSVAAGPHSLRTLSVISDSEVEALRAQLHKMVSAEVEVGAPVQVLEGKYSKMEGVVIGLDGDDALIQFDLRSWKRIASIPRVFLDQIDPDSH